MALHANGNLPFFSRKKRERTINVQIKTQMSQNIKSKIKTRLK